MISLLKNMRRSVLAFVVAEVLNLVSMGALGMALYYAGYPVLAPLFGDVNDWRGDSVWATIIGAGMLWPVFFLVAGWVNLRLERAGAGLVARRSSYVLILWLGAIVTWLLWAAFPAH